MGNRRIILQHWSGETTELVQRSAQNIAAYARRIGAEYRMLRGDVFRVGLTPPCQKLHMLSPAFDGFEDLVMLDADMFARTDEDVFDVPGIGICTEYTDTIKARMARTHPDLTSMDHPYWGGAIWKLSREVRTTFRAHLRMDEVSRMSGKGNLEDEGVMHRLATLADFRDPSILPPRWCWCSYRPGRENAAMIHMRKKARLEDSYRQPGDKLANYKALVECGILA